MYSSRALTLTEMSPQDQLKDNLFLPMNAAVQCSLYALDNAVKICFTPTCLAT